VQDDEAVVQRIAEVVEKWIDPFQSDEQLCHLASGLVATEEVKTALLNAHDKGLEALRSFADERLGRMEPSTSMPHYPICSSILFPRWEEETGSEATQAPVLKSTRDLFGRLLIMEKLLSYPLGPSPSPLPPHMEVPSKQ